jgi:hypothetical protein
MVGKWPPISQRASSKLDQRYTMYSGRQGVKLGRTDALTQTESLQNHTISLIIKQKYKLFEQTAYLATNHRTHHNVTHFVPTLTNKASQCLSNTEVRTYRSLNAMGDNSREVAFTAGGYKYIKYSQTCLPETIPETCYFCHPHL